MVTGRSTIKCLPTPVKWTQYYDHASCYYDQQAQTLLDFCPPCGTTCAWPKVLLEQQEMTSVKRIPPIASLTSNM